MGVQNKQVDEQAGLPSQLEGGLQQAQWVRASLYRKICLLCACIQHNDAIFVYVIVITTTSLANIHDHI